MSSISVNWQELYGGADALNQYRSQLGRYQQQMEQARSGLRATLGLSSFINLVQLSNCIRRLDDLQSRVHALSGALKDVAFEYESAECRILGRPPVNSRGIREIALDWIRVMTEDSWRRRNGWISWVPGLIPMAPLLPSPLILPLLLANSGIWGPGNLVEGTFRSGAISTTLFGGDLTAEGKILTGSIDTFGKAEWNIEDGEFGAKAGIKGEGSVLEGGVSYQNGDYSAGATGSVLTGGFTGSIGAGLWEDGHFRPSVNAEAKISGSVLHGELNDRFGSDDFNIHRKAEGDVLTADAYAKAGAGYITVTNSSGEEVNVLGAQAKAGAEAYVFKGEVSGGFSIFGIDIDVSAEGKALGAGVEAGGYVGTNGVSGKIGGGLGVGGSLEISIDWSDFKVPDWAKNWFHW